VARPLSSRVMAAGAAGGAGPTMRAASAVSSSADSEPAGL
jgi:hypothetical protein